MISEKIALAAAFYFGQIFLHANQQNLLEWFLPILCNEHTLRRSRSLFSRNHPICVFDWEETAGRLPILNS